MKMKAEVLSPIHIGSGKSLTPFDYVVEDGFINYDLSVLFAEEQSLPTS